MYIHFFFASYNGFALHCNLVQEMLLGATWPVPAAQWGVALRPPFPRSNLSSLRRSPLFSTWNRLHVKTPHLKANRKYFLFFANGRRSLNPMVGPFHLISEQ